MVAGQVLDLEGERNVGRNTLGAPIHIADSAVVYETCGAPRALRPTPDIEMIHQLKTAALIQAACVMGVIAGGGTEAQITAATRFAKAIGSAFQIRDDILDCVGDEVTLGKRIGSDAESGKTTFVTLYGIERAEEMLGEQTELAKAALGALDDTEGLLWLCDWLLRREK